MKIVLSDFNAKVGREDIFRSTICKYNLHNESNSNDVRIGFPTSKNLLKSTIFQHKDIHKNSWSSADDIMRNKIDYVLVNRRRHTSIIDIRIVRVVDCNSHHHLVNIRISLFSTSYKIISNILFSQLPILTA